MTEHNYERELGGINAKLETILAQQSEIFAQIRAGNVEVASLKANGCARGKRNAEDIAELKSRPGRLIELGACIVAITAAVIAWIKGS